MEDFAKNISKKEPQNCWDFWNCQNDVRAQCPAFTSNLGRYCWMVAGHMVTELKKCPRVVHHFKTCFECPWFKKLNPDSDK